MRPQLVQPRVHKSSCRQSLDMRAGMASVTIATNSLEMEELIVRAHLDTCGGPTQYLGSRAQSEHEEQGDKRLPVRAATKAHETVQQRGQGLTDGCGKEVGGKGTKGRHMRPDQPQGAVSALPHSPQPHQAQPHSEQQPTRSRMAAPAKLHEGIG